MPGRGTVKRGRAEDAESFGCGYGACGDDTVDRVLFVSGSDGTGGGVEQQCADKDIAADAEQLHACRAPNERRFVEDFQG